MQLSPSGYLRRFPEVDKSNEFAQRFDRTISNDKKQVLTSNGLNPLEVPTHSVLLKSDPRFAKSTLLLSWKRQLEIQANRLHRLKEYVISKDGLYIPCRGIVKKTIPQALGLIRSGLSQYSCSWLTESGNGEDFGIRDYIINQDFSSLHEKITGRKYIFIDDLFESHNWQVNSNTITFTELYKGYKSFWDYCVNNQENVIVIAATNNEPSEVIKDSAILGRVLEVFGKGQNIIRL